MDDSRRCTGKSKRSGQRCKRAASPGLGKCHIHAGVSKTVRETRASEVLAAELVRTYGLPRDISPTDALLEEVRYTAGHVAWLREQVQALESGDLVWGKREEAEKSATEFAGVDVTYAAMPNIWLELYYRERKHLLDVTKAAISVGIEERRVRLAEAQGQMVAEIIRRILARLELNAQQSALIPHVVPEELRRAALNAVGAVN
jgi:hypothetical protein